MNEEKMKILKMLEEKKISSADAMALLEALSRLEGKETHSARTGGRFLKIRVYENGAPGAKVNVNIPIAWSKFMAPFIEQKIGQKLKERGCEMDVEKIREALEAGEIGKIVDINDGGNKVEISIE
ncbi:MAG: hypothetical protein A2X28_00570 [Elusimicrobia bacterium GWA2_56_46]|nr:MAG: hypothetical protein A2X28_00570 [Elusimicrobia bacterium GWA2_56_46]OGR55861.1 MAG: hypothetical protein A2X39_05945 [Elusimicrobia bacterium GWC2_56_31]HBB65971.1 hypothetical protein [Elusimicrobiota bacterium]HBW22206.1 hypothetical protein [Elusimicrobiota bacterium]